MQRMIMSIFLPRWEVDLARRRLMRDRNHAMGLSAAQDHRHPIIDHRMTDPRHRNPSRPAGTRRQPEPLILITRQVAQQHKVAACCRPAEKLGICAGMSLAHARALAGQHPIRIVETQPAGAMRALEALGRWATQFTPIVGIDPAPAPGSTSRGTSGGGGASGRGGTSGGGGGLLLDLTGCERLFGGWDRLADRVRRGLDGLGLTYRLGMAPTVGAAWALARFGENPGVGCVTRQEQLGAVLDALPVAALRLEGRVVEVLGQVGIERVGELREISRPALHARFGEGVCRSIELAMGEREELIAPLHVLECVEVVRQPAGPVKQLEAVVAALREMLEVLCRRLDQLGRGVTELEVKLKRCDGRLDRLSIRLSQPSKRAEHLWVLLRPEAERIDVGEGLDSLELRAAQMDRLPSQQLALLPASETWDEQSKAAEQKNTSTGAEPGGKAQDASDQAEDGGHAWQSEILRSRLQRASVGNVSGGGGGGTSGGGGELVDILSARLGSGSVLVMQVRACHEPERGWVAACASDHGVGRRVVDDRGSAQRLHRPTRLIHPAERVWVLDWDDAGCPSAFQRHGREHQVCEMEGPERIVPSWWLVGNRPRPARDYFRVLDQWGQWWWLYRQSSSGSPLPDVAEGLAGSAGACEGGGAGAKGACRPTDTGETLGGDEAKAGSETGVAGRQAEHSGRGRCSIRRDDAWFVHGAWV